MTTPVDRRHFLKASLSAAGSLVLSLHLPLAQAALGKPFSPNAFLTIGSDGLVTMIMPFVEMGQGTYTSIPMLIAEELEVDLAAVKLQHAPAAEKIYGHPLFGFQLTGGSATIRGAFLPMRQAGAAARMMLISAAAQMWKVPEQSCHARSGEVLHAASGRKLKYGELVATATGLPVPEKPALKPAAQMRLVGKSVKRLDVPAKTDGSARFGIDAQIPGMKIAAIAACPVFGGTLAAVDDRKARAVKGVRKIVKLENAVAVIADHNGAARKGLAALAITWNDGPNASFSSQEWERRLEAAAGSKGVVAVSEGNFGKLIGDGARQQKAVYYAPFLAHATMEPMNCTAHVRKDGVDIWTGTQSPGRAQAFVAAALKIDAEKVKINNHLLGGGFGRRLEADFVVQAALVASQVDYPVKVIWSREEDIQHDMYRPFYRDEVAAALDDKGMPVGFSHRIVGASVVARFAPAWMANGIDTDAVAEAESPYDFAHKYVEFQALDAPVPTGFWRGVGPTHNIFVVESFIDELALAAGKDPLAYRQALLTKQPRALAVLNLAAQKAGWGTRLAPGSGMGIAVAVAWGSFAAAVVECSVGKDGQVVLKRVVSAVDCGQPVNPDGIVAQMEGGQVFGLTAALYGKLTVENGRIVQSNFHDYQLARMTDVPPMEVHIISNNESPGGMGELGTALIGPAIANAVFAASGKRVRRLPLDAEVLKSA